MSSDKHFTAGHDSPKGTAGYERIHQVCNHR